MKFSFINSLLTTLIVSFFSLSQAMAVDMHGVMCGSDIRPADQKVIDEFMNDNNPATPRYQYENCIVYIISSKSPYINDTLSSICGY